MLSILSFTLPANLFAQKLEVEGEAFIGSPGQGNNLLTLVSERNWIFRQYNTGPSTALELYDATGLKNFLINTTGNVGIDKLLPTAKLDVNGTVKGYSYGGYGVFGESATTDGVIGISSSSLYAGVFGTCPFGTGVWGVSSSGVGIRGKSDSGTGVSGESRLGAAVHGLSTFNNAIVGISTFGAGISGSSDMVGVNGEGGTYDFNATGMGIDYGATSSRRWKTNITNIPSPLEKIAQLRGVYFDWDEAHGGHHDVGFIAEEIGEVLPEIVGYEKNGIDATGLDYSKMTPLLVEAVNAMRKEHNEKINAIKAELKEYQATSEIQQSQLHAVTAQLDELTKLLQMQNANHTNP